MTNLPRTA